MNNTTSSDYSKFLDLEDGDLLPPPVNRRQEPRSEEILASTEKCNSTPDNFPLINNNSAAHPAAPWQVVNAKY